jgi:hypothetical protein
MSWRARWVNPGEGLTTRELPKGSGLEAGESVGRPKGRTVIFNKRLRTADRDHLTSRVIRGLAYALKWMVTS